MKEVPYTKYTLDAEAFLDFLEWCTEISKNHDSHKICLDCGEWMNDIQGKGVFYSCPCCGKFVPTVKTILLMENMRKYNKDRGTRKPRE